MADADSAVALDNTPSPFSLRFIGDDSGETFRRAEQASERAARKQEQIGARAERLGAEEQQAMAAPRAAAERALSSPRPEIPEQEKVPNPPKAEDYQKLSMGYLGAMVLLGAFGGKFIRGGGNAALSAFNGALKGWQEGNLEAYQNASAEWKEKQQQVLDNNRAKLDKYRTILDDRNASIQEQMFRMKLVSAEFQDRLMYDRTAAENYNGAAQLYEKQASIQQRVQKTTQDLIDRQTQDDAQAVERANQWKAHLATPQGQQEFNQLTPAQQFQIKGFIDTYADAAPAAAAAPSPPATVGGGEMTAAPAETKRVSMRPELRSRAMPKDLKTAARDQLYRETYAAYQRGERESPDPTLAEIAGAERKMHAPRSAAGMSLQEFIEERRAVTGQDPSSAEIREFQAGQAAQISASRAAGTRMGNIMVSSTEFANVLPLASAASANVPRSKWRPINQLMNNWRLMRSDPAYQNFVDANEGAITAYSATMSRSGANTVHAQQRADRVLSTATSDEAYQSGLEMLQSEVDAVERSPRDALKKIREIFGPQGAAPQGSTGERFKKSGWSKEGDVEPPRGGGGWSAQEIR